MNGVTSTVGYLGCCLWGDSVTKEGWCAIRDTLLADESQITGVA
jgi:hypothetical protein